MTHHSRPLPGGAARFGALSWCHRIFPQLLLILSTALLPLAPIGCKQEKPSARTEQDEASQKTPVTIGAIFSLTGNAAAYGNRARNGIDLAVAELNSKGGIDGRTLVVLYEDDKGEPREGVSAINKLIAVDKVPAILGPQISGVAMAVAPIAQRKHVVLLLPGANTPELDNAGGYIFRNMPSSSTDGRKAANVIYNNLGVQRVALTYPSNAGSTGIALAFADHYRPLGGTVAVQLPYDPAETNFRTIIQLIKDANVNLVYAPGYNTDVGLLIKQARELGLDVRFFGAPALQSPKFLEIAGPAAENALFTNVAFDPNQDDKHIKEFVSAFRERHGVEPDIFAAMAYDAAKLIAEAIGASGYSSDKIRQYLQNVKDYRGVSGQTSFNAQGSVEKEVGVFIISNGRFIPWASDGS